MHPNVLSSQIHHNNYEMVSLHVNQKIFEYDNFNEVLLELSNLGLRSALKET